MAQQTAVDYIIEQLLESGHLTIEASYYCKHLIRQAKNMEKEQIQKAFSDGQETPINHPTLPHYSREEYYNETYKTT